MGIMDLPGQATRVSSNTNKLVQFVEFNTAMIKR